MKILLVTPSQPRILTRWIPVGIAYLASSLMSSGHEVRVYDRHRKDFIFQNKEQLEADFKTVILAYSPDIVGFSTVSPLIYDTAEAVAFIRTFFDGIVVAGGHHATAMPFETLIKIPGVDYIIAGEGELSLTALANGQAPETIPGVFTRSTDSNKFTNARNTDLDSLPFPEYDVFDMEFYTKANIHTIRSHYLKTAEVLSSRGCNNNCSFCSETLTYGRGVRFHSSDYVIECIERLLKKYDINAIYFHDNDFLILPKHAEEICQKLIAKGLNKKIKWAVQSGTDKINDNILKLMSEAGCIGIEFGMESIKESDLAMVNKNRLVNLNEKAIDLCRKHNISVHSYFITGFEGESIEDLNALLKWIKEYQPQSFLINPLKIHPGTQLYRDKGNSYFENHDWTKENIQYYYNTNSQNNITEEDFKKWKGEVLTPFSLNHHRKWIVKNNTPLSILKLIFSKIYNY